MIIQSLVLAGVDVMLGHRRLHLWIRLIGVPNHRICVILVEERTADLRQVQILSLSYLLSVFAEEHKHEDGEEQSSAKQTPSSDDHSITSSIIRRLDATVTAVSTRRKAVTATKHHIVALTLEGISRAEVPTTCALADLIATRERIDDRENDAHGNADDAAPKQQAKDLGAIHELLSSHLHSITKILD